jgi:hypothetical protein
MPSSIHARKGNARRTNEAALEMAWWNAMTECQRAEALRAADSECPSDAWDHWRQNAAGFKCEEVAHG